VTWPKLVFDVLPVDPARGRMPVPELVLYPEPEVSSRDGVWKESVSAVRALGRFGAESGWLVRVQYSRGCKPHATTGRPGGVKDWWAVRFGWGDQWGAYAVHDGRGWDSLCVWGASLPPFTALNVTDLKAFLARPAVATPEWLAAIRTREAQKVARAKAAAASRPRKGSSEGL
jgi:hypothetical protein